MKRRTEIAQVAALLALLAIAPAHAARRVPPQHFIVSPSSRPLVYVAIGASDSYGVGAFDPQTQSWPAVLARLLPHGTRFVNLGVPAILLSRAVQIELPVALDAHPGLVTLFLGVNDLAAGVALSRYRHDLAVLLAALRRHTATRVLVGNLPDLALVPALAGHPGLAAAVATWNAAIAAEARAHGATLVDLFARWRDLAQHPEYIGPDGLHPSVEGYRQLAMLFWQAYLHG